jgi:hypothetical protein
MGIRQPRSMRRWDVCSRSAEVNSVLDYFLATSSGFHSRETRLVPNSDHEPTSLAQTNSSCPGVVSQVFLPLDTS